jgi:hypothetical protein
LQGIYLKINHDSSFYEACKTGIGIICRNDKGKKVMAGLPDGGVVIMLFIVKPWQYNRR